MPQLDNPKHEQFAIHVANGKSQEEAYHLAGYRGDRTTASRLATRANVAARIAQLRNEVQIQVKEAALIDAERTMLELTRIATAQLPAFFNDKGEMLPMSKWTEDMRAAVAGLEFETLPAKGRRKERTVIKKIKLEPKAPALGLIAKVLGMIVERSESKNTNFTVYQNMSPQELAFELTAMTLEARKKGAQH